MRTSIIPATPNPFSDWKELLNSKSTNALKVLAVGYDNVESSVVVKTLRSCDADVTTVGDGVQALAIMRHTHFDMIFTELPLPGMDSLELITIAKEMFPETEVYVVTAYGTLENAVKCMKKGAEGFIIKPEIADQVVVSIAKAKDRRLLRRLAYTDGLTSLLNRDTFKQFLLQECHRSMRYGYSFGLMILDVDNFKQYNELNGHLLGDIALIKLCKLLKENTRTSDVLARYGGDEFAVILAEISPPEAFLKANRIRLQVSSTQFQNVSDMPDRKLTVSIGLAMYPKHKAGFFEIMQSADQALRQAKREGRNRLCVFEKKAEKKSLGAIS